MEEIYLVMMGLLIDIDMLPIDFLQNPCSLSIDSFVLYQQKTFALSN